MKVLHVLDTSVPDTSGYTTRARYLTVAQKSLGVEPVVLTSERFQGYSGASRETIEGIRHYRSHPRDGFVRKIPLVAELDEIRELRQRVADVVSEQDPDIVHAHSPSLIGAACEGCCRERNLPFVYEIRAFWEDAAVDRGAVSQRSLRYALRRHHETFVAKRADAVITICDGLRQDLEKREVGADRIRVVPNGVDHERFRPISADRSLEKELGCSDKVVIGFIGTFFHFEGLQHLVRAMKRIVADEGNAVLLLVGEGQMYRELQALTRDIGLEDHVLFTGRVPHDQVLRYYSIMDMLVYPRISRRITELVTPLKPLEAMSMAKPTVMSDVGGLRELADAPDVAKFFEAGNDEDLARQCLSLCSDPELRERLGRNARRNVVANWGWEERAEETIDIYRGLTQHPAGDPRQVGQVEKIYRT